MKIFSVTKTDKRKIINLLGLKISFKRKKHKPAKESSSSQTSVNPENNYSKALQDNYIKQVLLQLNINNIDPASKKVFDCLMFFNELELLHLRFMEYYDVVDYFVIVESTKSHTGKNRDLLFEANKQKFAKYLDKVIYVVVDDLPDYSIDDIWKAENFQRNAIQRGLEGVAKIGDIIMVSDCDEFWDKKYLDEIKQSNKIHLFTQELYFYYVNCKQNCTWGSGTVSSPYGILTPQEMRQISIELHNKVMLHGIDIIEKVLAELNLKRNWIKAHFLKGWHYSYMGGSAKIQQKVNNIAESHVIIDEVGTATDISQKMETANDLWGRKDDYAKKFFIDLDKKDYKPSALNEFMQEYPHFVHNREQKKIKKSIEIISLIYCSVDYLNLIVEELKKIRENGQKTGWDIGIRIVANDPNEKVEEALKNIDIPYTIYHDKNPDEYYINRVYRCYNTAVQESSYDNVCLINSDMLFEKDFLPNLLKYHDGYNIPVARLVESGKMPSGKYGISAYFGNSPDNIEFERWTNYAEKLKSKNSGEIYLDGLYMPVIFEKQTFLNAGGYPEGNIYEDGSIGTCNGSVIKSGDNYFFDKLKEMLNMTHITVFDSLCYHIQEGERDEQLAEQSFNGIKGLPANISTWKHNPKVNEDAYRQLRSLQDVKTIYDFGAGDGFWGKLCKYTFDKINITGVELEKKYIKNFKLKEIYNKIINDDIVKVSEYAKGDLIICSDVLEHLEKEDFKKVINNIRRNFDYILINAPIGFQEQEHENPSELHRCGLEKQDFIDLDLNLLEWNQYDDDTMFNTLIKGEKIHA